MQTVNLTINGQSVTARIDQTILDVVREQNLDNIPTLCHSPELPPYGSCFVCVVEVKGRRNLAPSCATKVAEGMEVETRNERVISTRRTALELLLSNHYADCVSPCMEACPAGVDVQGYIALCAMDETQKAVDLIRQTNPLPSVCGRVCVRRCEVVCRRQDVDSPVAINNIKRYVTDTDGIYDKDPTRKPSRNKSVGIIGAGPAGLTAAWFLGKEGYDPVIYESMEKAGGMLRYGIPTYRLTDETLDKEIDYIVRAGTQINTGVRVGKNISFDEIKEKHDAMFISVGAWKSKSMRVEGEHDTDGVIGGVEFLIEKAKSPEPITGTIVVIGGGNTAMDCARTSWRLGADKVIILYRRTKAEMPADKYEIEDCLKESIEIMELAAPVGIVKDGNKLKSLKCIRMKLGEPDDSGRRRPVPLEGSEFELPCDIALSAIGQEPVLDGITEISENSPTASRWNTLDIDTQTMKTNVDGVFAGGDSADDGPTVVIDAIRDGQKAAKSIHHYLSDEDLEIAPFIVKKEFWAKPGKAELGDIKESPRHEIHELDVEERRNSFKEVSLGYEYEDAAHECDRCLSCGCIRFSDCDLRLYAEEYGVDMTKFVGYIRKHKVDDRHPYIEYDPNKCVLCARCIRTCDRVLPISALGLVGRGFKTEMRPSMNDALLDTNCISCGNCVDACPTGALSIKYPFHGRADITVDESTSHCGFCSIGCPITVKKISNQRYYITSSGNPGDYLCHYGRFANQFFIQERRLVGPLEREGAKHHNINTDDAFEKIIKAMKDASEKFGPESIAVFVSPELTNEELYLASRIARDGFGTNNIASLTYLETGLESGYLDASLGFTASTSNKDVLKDADVIFCNNIGSGNDNLILNVDILEAAKKNAKLIVSSSTGDPFEPFSALSLDPMRGRASLMINGIIQILLDRKVFDRENIKSMPGGKDFIEDIVDYSPASINDRTGVDEKKLFAAADLIQNAKKIVFVHSPYRAIDKSPSDYHVIANLMLLLKSHGIDSDLLLPSAFSNFNGLEITGADTAFMPGRIPATGIPGAKTHEELLSMLKDGKIKAAFIIGEDPMRDDRIASYFRNIEFLAAMDWKKTETILFANISLPSTTYLESDGSRCNFEGRLIDYNAAIMPASGIQGWNVLSDIALKSGIKNLPASIEEIKDVLSKLVFENNSSSSQFYLNTGQDKNWDGSGNLITVDVSVMPKSIILPMTAMEHIKREIRDIGFGHYRVH